MTKPQQTNEHMREVINHSTHIHLLNPRKSELKSKILKPRQIGGVEQLSTSCRALMNLHSLLDFLNRLEGFNTRS